MVGKKATHATTLWFWNTEIGWALVHPVLEKHGWQYVGCNVWNKGLSHIAGNINTRTIRRFPVVTEVCVEYVRKPMYQFVAKEEGAPDTLQDWLRREWMRTGLPFNKANEACGVKNAATRKYLTTDHNWYFPPPDMFQKLVDYANKYGREEGKPYFSMDGKVPMTGCNWKLMRAIFRCPVGVTNV